MDNNDIAHELGRSLGLDPQHIALCIRRLREGGAWPVMTRSAHSDRPSTRHMAGLLIVLLTGCPASMAPQVLAMVQGWERRRSGTLPGYTVMDVMARLLNSRRLLSCSIVLIDDRACVVNAHRRGSLPMEATFDAPEANIVGDLSSFRTLSFDGIDAARRILTRLHYQPTSERCFVASEMPA